MLNSMNKADRPYVLCGVGGPLLAFIYGLIGHHKELKSLFICPLWAPILIPLFFLSPSLASLWLIKVKHARDKTHPLGLSFYLLLQILWFVLLYSIYAYISYKTAILWDIYAQAAAQSQTLQIATPEQMRFSHDLLQVYAIAAVFFILGFVYIVTVSFSKLLGSTKPFTIAMGAVWTNLPGYLLLICLSIAIFSIVEKYFAVLKLQYLEAYILGRDAFRPDYCFIVLRLYLYEALQFAFIVVSASSLKLLSIGKRKA